MTRLSQQKGRAFERDVRDIFRAAKIDAVLQGIYDVGDLLAPLDGRDWKVECKRRKRGFSSLYDFLSKTEESL